MESFVCLRCLLTAVISIVAASSMTDCVWKPWLSSVSEIRDYVFELPRRTIKEYWIKRRPDLIEYEHALFFAPSMIMKQSCNVPII